MIKAGVLYPRSGIYPLLGADFLTGIKTSLAYHQCADQIQLVTIPVDFGSNEKEVYQKTEQLLIQQETDIIIAFLDLRAIDIVQPLFTATGKLFLVVNPGANYPDNWVPAPGTVFLTLLDSFLSHLTGILAAADGNTRSVLAASFYDGGYAHTATMVNGFTAYGGRIEFNYISPHKLPDFTLAPLEDFLKAQKEIRSLLCLFSGTESNMFYEELNKIPGADQLQLYVSPMMLEEQNVASLETQLNFSVQGYIPWHSHLQKDDNVAFRKTVSEKSGREANLFSLLGWEAGLILRLAVTNNISDGNGEKIAGLLHKTPLNSPRGLLQTDVSTNYMIAPVYRAGLNNDHSLLIREILDKPEEAWAAYVKAEKGTPHSGWLNTYLCY